MYPSVFSGAKFQRAIEMDGNNYRYWIHRVPFRGNRGRNSAGVAGLGMDHMRSFGSKRRLTESVVVQDGA